ncbi:TPA: hypothetical protein DD449_04145 [Candidatus Berkelbacteria bacterium]|uniref:Uncharacterized protein n=1 Tax=Berkelbacteria bacterium GW2011_GWE1_39_12 TaxID=1618337 RepID=A0A0G4B3Y4_9BACT|nr:MAG: hypothetical protein UT28_C0001G0450 [Berkelbacteria bacterium GW2011_GWE1_39_12]HBO60846.1 hypothetical protein [Candidatus Berkelbacteria bacterium]
MSLISEYDELVTGKTISVELENSSSSDKKTINVHVGIYRPSWPYGGFYKQYRRYPHCTEYILFRIFIKIEDNVWSDDLFPTGGVKHDPKKTAAENWVSQEEVLNQARDRMNEIAQSIRQEISRLYIDGTPLVKWLQERPE